MTDTPHPLHEVWTEAGARFESPDGVRRNMSFSDPETEVAALRSGCGLIDRGDLATLLLTGTDRTSFLHRQVSNHVEELGPGSGCYATHLTPQGKIIAAMEIACGEDALRLTVDGSAVEALAKRLDMFVLHDDVTVTRADEAPLLFAGPAAREAVSALLGRDLPELPPYASVTAGDATVIGDHTTGVPGFRVHLAPAAAADLARRALERPDVSPVGHEAWNLARLEAGTPCFGVDFDGDSLPPEANLDHAIHYAKGCYVGQEIIARMNTYGQAPRRLVGLKSDEVLIPGAPLANEDGVEIGHVTSAGHSPTLGAPIAMGYARKGFNAAGTKLAQVQGGRKVAIEVVDLPFV